MATTPEDFFVNGLMEQSPPSPSLFIDLPSIPHCSSEGYINDKLCSNDMMLPYISRMLMEDDIDDKLIDHPAVLQVQQPFAEILSAPLFSTNGDKNASRSNTERANDLLHDDRGNPRTLDSSPSNGVDAVGAFLMGMEEAKIFLPKFEGFKMDELFNHTVEESNHSGLKNRYTRDEHLEEVSMTGKSMMMIKGLEEFDERDMLDEMMFHGYDKCIREMEKLQITMANEVVMNNRKGGSKTPRNVIDLSSLLINCARAVAINNHSRAWELLNEIKQHTSVTGDPMQRLAQCFTMGLEARLMGKGSQHWQLLMAERPSFVESLEAYILYLATCCFVKVALCFSIRTIMDAVAGKRKLHIVDYGLNYGLQWAGLFRLLANREGGPPDVKITAIGCPQHWSYLPDRIEEIGCWLRKCAHKLGLASFTFHAITTKWQDVCIEEFSRDVDEVLIVNDMFNFSTLMDESVFFDDPNPRDTVLNNIKKMRPDVFIQSIVNCSYGTSFLSRFRGALFYFMALFDIFDATIPRESKQRMVLEQGLFGRYALNIIACEGVDLLERPEKYRQWQARNQRAGLRQRPLKPDIIKLVRDKVKKYHKEFLLVEDGQWLLQGWMGRILFAHSTWVAENTCSK